MKRNKNLGNKNKYSNSTKENTFTTNINLVGDRFNAAGIDGTKYNKKNNNLQPPAAPIETKKVNSLLLLILRTH